MDTEQFVKDRHEAFKSMDKEKIRAYCKKYGMQTSFPRNETVWKAGIHKAILECTDFSDDEKRESVVWLLLHGYQQDCIGNPLYVRFGYLMPDPPRKEEL